MFQRRVLFVPVPRLNSSSQCHREIPTSNFQVDLGAHHLCLPPFMLSASFLSTVGDDTMSPTAFFCRRIKHCRINVCQSERCVTFDLDYRHRNVLSMFSFHWQSPLQFVPAIWLWSRSSHSLSKHELLQSFIVLKAVLSLGL